jgi:hypothetical protein
MTKERTKDIITYKRHTNIQNNRQKTYKQTNKQNVLITLNYYQI